MEQQQVSVQSSQKNKYCFYNHFENNLNNYTSLIVSITKKFYSDECKYYYYITYHFENYINKYKQSSTSNNFKTHPFNDLTQEQFDNMKDGVIILENDLTKKLVEYLMMNDDELQQKIGRTFPNDYRKHIIKFIDSLWD
jgi:hypothetical protein